MLTAVRFSAGHLSRFFIVGSRQEVAEVLHVAFQLLQGDARIDLRGGNVGMAQQPADALDGHAGIEGHDGEGVARTVEGDVAADAAALHDGRNVLGQRAIVDGAKDGTFVAGVALQDGLCLGSSFA